MKNYFQPLSIATWLMAALCGSVLLRAEATRSWTQTDLDDFLEGSAERVSLRSDGRLLLAPRFREIYDAPASYLWAVAPDSKGNAYVSGGPDAKVFRINPSGEASSFFEANAVSIHALAVDGDDNLYVATSAPAAVYKVSPAGKSSAFFEPESAYIWDMAFDAAGNLYLATGDEGRVYRVSPAGEGSVFFETQETHVRTLAIDPDGNLIVGTDPSGLILRVSASPGGDDPVGFVLYQSSKKEITTLVRAVDGAIYAAGVGDRQAIQGPPGRPSIVSTVSSGPTAVPPSVMPASSQLGAQALPPPAISVPTPVRGGSEIYRIAPDGEPKVVWESKTDIAYTLAFSPDGRLLIGTGDRGRLIRLEEEDLYTVLLTATSSQITALAPGRDGTILVATSNIGRLYRLGPELESEGSFESKPFDAEIFSHWGRLEWEGEAPASAKIAVSTRSGNVASPSRNWSVWSEPVTVPAGARVSSPAARFVQWQAVLSASSSESPILDSVTLYYRPNNIAPRVTQIEATPPNYEFSPQATATASAKMTLPPLGAGPRTKTGSKIAAATAAQSISSAQGYVGVRWAVEDANGDDLEFKIEIRGEGEQEWKLLEEKVEQEFLSWDSTSFADGRYQVRVTATDAPSNTASDAKSHDKVSELFLIDNTAPVVENLHAERGGDSLRVHFRAADGATKIQKAEYSIDGSDWRTILPEGRLFDSKELSFDFQTEAVGEGEHTVAVKLHDSHDNVAATKTVVR